MQCYFRHSQPIGFCTAGEIVNFKSLCEISLVLVGKSINSQHASFMKKYFLMTFLWDWLQPGYCVPRWSAEWQGRTVQVFYRERSRLVIKDILLAYQDSFHISSVRSLSFGAN